MMTTDRFNRLTLFYLFLFSGETTPKQIVKGYPLVGQGLTKRAFQPAACLPFNLHGSEVFQGWQRKGAFQGAHHCGNECPTTSFGLLSLVFCVIWTYRNSAFKGMTPLPCHCLDMQCISSSCNLQMLQLHFLLSAIYGCCHLRMTLCA